jgi:DNA-binding CsgD family transcriptional regulator
VEVALIKAISAIHRSDSLDGFEQAFLSNVSAAIEADAFGIYLLDAKRKVTEKIVSTGAPRVFIEQYESYRSVDPIYEYVVNERCVADGASLLGSRDWRSHPLREWMRHWGLQHSLQGPLIINGEVAGTVNFARGAACGPFTARSRWLAQVICDEASAALERLLQRRETAVQLDLLAACFECVPMPLVITDGGGGVRALNRRARSSTQDSPSARARPGPLHRVTQIVSELATSAKDSMAVRTDAGDAYMSMRLNGCGDLYLSAWNVMEAPPGTLLDTLPERSRQVAELLLQGRQNKWIAWRLGISRDTVKYHVRRVYSLLGVSSRVELLRLAMRAKTTAHQATPAFQRTVAGPPVSRAMAAPDCSGPIVR